MSHSTTTVVNIHRHADVIEEAKRQGTYTYIGRGSPWGNPFTHLDGPTKAEFKVKRREEAVARYREYILTRPDLLARLPELEGKCLGCFCAPKACHGDILVELLNALKLLRQVYGVELDLTNPAVVAGLTGKDTQ